jgi:hypothetical protein
MYMYIHMFVESAASSQRCTSAMSRILTLSLSLSLYLALALALSRALSLSLQVETARCLFTAVLLCDSTHFEALCGRAAVWVRARMYEHAVADAGAAAALRTDDPRVYSLEVLSVLGLLVQKYIY